MLFSFFLLDPISSTISFMHLIVYCLKLSSVTRIMCGQLSGAFRAAYLITFHWFQFYLN